MKIYTYLFGHIRIHTNTHIIRQIKTVIIAIAMNNILNVS